MRTARSSDGNGQEAGAFEQMVVSTQVNCGVESMRTRRLHVLGAVLSALVVGGSAADTRGQAPGDLNGLWQAPYTPDLSVAYGKDLPFTAFGKERWAKVDTANDPTGFCLPVGPARGIQAPFPLQIVQTPAMVAILFEYQRTYRMIYTDGRKPPADIHDYPEWMGFSTGRWEDGTLVVDTVAINDRTWLDTAGHEHSDKLRLTERFKKTGPDSIEWSVTFDDPVFFVQPWTVTRPLKRLTSDDRVMSYSCEENNKDIPHLRPTKPPGW
jgi:hypothetical protein